MRSTFQKEFNIIGLKGIYIHSFLKFRDQNVLKFRIERILILDQHSHTKHT